MFGPIALGILIAVVVVIVLHFIVALTRRGRGGTRSRGLGLFGGLVYLVLILSTAALAITSLYTVFTEGHMRGWFLWVHLAAAGAFTVSLVLAALLWAAACDMCGPVGTGDDPRNAPPRFGSLTRISFWVLIVAGSVSLGSMLLGMLTLFGTREIETLIDIHRYSGLAAVAAAVLHLYSVTLAPGRGAPSQPA